MNRSIRLKHVAIAAALAAVFSAPASANLVSNGSFEAGALAPTPGNAISVGNGSTAIAGWLVTSSNGGNIEWEGQGYSTLATPDGTHLIDMTGNPDGARATISQSITTVSGSTYRLTFIVGVNTNDGSFTGPVGIQLGVNNDVQTFQDINPTGRGPNNDGNIWTSESYDFTASSELTTLSFLGVQGRNYIGLDSVDVEFLRAAAPVGPGPAAVPEPAVLGLLGLGLVAMAAQRRRKSVTQAA